MTEDPLAKITPDNLAAALRGYYTPPRPGNVVIEGDALAELLQTLPSLSSQDHVDPILVQLGRHHRGSSFNPTDHATIAFVDDAVTEILRQTDLDFKIESFVRSLAPFIAALAVREGVTAITQPQVVLALIDLLMRECIGWSEDLGILGDQFMDKVEGIVRPLITNKTSIEACHGELEGFFAKEDPVFTTMEQRLRDSEMAVLVQQKAKYHAGELLNRLMAGKPLPLFPIFMLQGSWYEFLQGVFMAHGQKSKEWQSAVKLSEALVWSLQPQADAAKQHSLISALPGRIRAFCSHMKFDTSQMEASLGDVDAEYEQIRTGHPSEPCDFDLIDVDARMDDNVTIEPETLKTVQAMRAGQWFLYDDPADPDEKLARIKLILNWSDTDRLLFTNHNRRKVLPMAYAELARHLSDGSVKLLTPRDGAHTIIQRHLVSVIHGIQQQKKREVQIDAAEQRKEVSQEYLSKRKEALTAALELHRQQAEVKRQRAMVLRHKAEEKLRVASEAVHSLKVEAWMKLPVMEGTLTPCRLVAIIPGTDKYIFANRSGIKVAEYTGSQLSNMIVTENSEILDTGAEFANVLASVVTGLREDRNKSYDELTGDVA